ncbi:MAG: RNA 2',3'-cyclic phosphodiesterase [Bacteroidia bacterium]|nr:RNA 2',3'-cyclic phosphodiesterase [Bacteroidia bacterium]
MNHSLVRSFIALYPDAEALEHIAMYIHCLTARDRSVRWEKPGQVHITLKFLGDMEPQALDAIAAALETSCRATGEAIGRIDTVGAFPNFRDPGVLWLGFSTAAERFIALRNIVENVCAQAGLDRERKKFTPHFTIGRVRQRGRGGDLENVLHACSFRAVPVRCTSIRIMESTLTPKGAIHRERASIILTPGE